MKNSNLNENYEKLMTYSLKLYCRDNEEDNNGLIAVYEKYYKDYLKSVDCINFKGQYEKIFEPFIQRAVNSSSRLLKIYAYANKGYYLNCIGDYPKAVEYNEKALKLCKKEFREDNLVKIDVMSNLAEDYAEDIDIDDPNLFAQFEKALKLRKRVLAFRKNDRGEKHLDTISAMADVADSYRWVFKYEKAVKLGRKVLRLYKEVLGPGNPYTIYARMNLSCYLKCCIEDGDKHSKEKYKELLKLDKETLKLSKEAFGEQNCGLSSASVICSNSGLSTTLDDDGYITVYYNDMNCSIDNSGNSNCGYS